jgi:hypothetical protein
MIDLKDLARPPVLLALAGSAALGFAAGFLLGRDPRLLQRVLAAAAQGWEQTRLAVAETREELADQWAAAREQAVHDVDEATFAAATAAAGAAPETASATEAAPAAAPAPKPRRAARRSTPRTTH